MDYDGGTVDFHPEKGYSNAGTEPAAYTRAVGTLNGESFDVDNYFQLVYNPGHHHFTRHYIVLFDAPISGVCGLKYMQEYDSSLLSTVDCNLSDINSLTITREEGITE